jgi:hypothetical protein
MNTTAIQFLSLANVIQYRVRVAFDGETLYYHQAATKYLAQKYAESYRAQGYEAVISEVL